MDNELLAVDTEEIALGPLDRVRITGDDPSYRQTIPSRPSSLPGLAWLARTGCSRLTSGIFAPSVKLQTPSVTEAVYYDDPSLDQFQIRTPPSRLYDPFKSLMDIPTTSATSRTRHSTPATSTRTRESTRTYTRNLPLSPCRRGLEDKRSGFREIKKESPHKKRWHPHITMLRIGVLASWILVADSHSFFPGTR